MLTRIRKLHQHRTKQCILLQCTVRRHFARRLVQRLRKKRAVLLLQRFTRGCIARQKCAYLRAQAAAIGIQRYYRGYRGKKLFRTLFIEAKRAQIQRWAKYHICRRRVKAATRIVLCARQWLQWRRRCAGIVFHSVRLYFLFRRNRILLLQRYVQLMQIETFDPFFSAGVILGSWNMESIFEKLLFFAF